MTTFHPQQFDRGQSANPKAGASALQISVTNCPTKSHAHVHEARKIQCNNVQSTVQTHIIELSFYAEQALPLVWTRILRLAESSPTTVRSPARRSRDGRATTGKTTGEISRVISAQSPGNDRAIATAMPPTIQRDNMQDNLPCGGCERAMSAPETGETTRLKSQS